VAGPYKADHCRTERLARETPADERTDPLAPARGVPPAPRRAGGVGIVYGLEQWRCRRREPHARPTTGNLDPRDSDARTRHLRRSRHAVSTSSTVRCQPKIGQQMFLGQASAGSHGVGVVTHQAVIEPGLDS
jgi:hypothetical protein